MRFPSAGSSERERRGVPILVLVAAATVAFLVGLLLGGGSGGARGRSDQAGASVGPASWRDGVPVGFTHSPAGAAQAVASYERAFADPSVLDVGALRRRIDVVATPDFAPTMLAANAAGTRRIAGGPIGIGLGEGIATIFAAVPIGYRIEAYSPQRAKVLTWGFTLLGNASAVEPAAYFGLTWTELAWSGGDWKIAGSRGGFGPTPKLLTPRHPLEGFDVLKLARELRSYGTTP
jgi:hypothetical protein